MTNTITSEGVFSGLESELLHILESTEGQWAIVIESLDGKGFLRLNADSPFTAASVIKIPIMMAAFNHARTGSLRLDDVITMTIQDKVGGSGVLKELHAGLGLTLLDAINLMIVVSDNTATNLVIDCVSIEKINEYMTQKGCVGSRLEAHLMKPKPGGPYNTITAEDIGLLLKGLAQRTIENPGDCDTMIDILSRQQYNQKLPRYLPKDAICAHKTGEVTGVTHDAGIITGPKGKFVIVCLSQNLDDVQKGDDAIGKVAKWAYDLLN